MTGALRVFGRRVLAAEEENAASDSQATVGRRLLHLIFGTQDDGQQLPGVLADLVENPGSKSACAALTYHVDAALQAEPEMASAVVEIITAFYRRRAEGGDLQALVDLGDLLYWDEPEGARAAYQEAIDAGHRHAMIDLAKVLLGGPPGRRRRARRLPAGDRLRRP
jgi:hypothetical protein